jgi:hypothetical protein
MTTGGVALRAPDIRQADGGFLARKLVSAKVIAVVMLKMFSTLQSKDRAAVRQ